MDTDFEDFPIRATDDDGGGVGFCTADDGSGGMDSCEAFWASKSFPKLSESTRISFEHPSDVLTSLAILPLVNSDKPVSLCDQSFFVWRRRKF